MKGYKFIDSNTPYADEDKLRLGAIYEVTYWGGDENYGIVKGKKMILEMKYFKEIELIPDEER